MGRHGLVLFASSVLLASLSPGPARAYTFIDVANSTTSPYAEFGAPSINAAGDVAFRAEVDAGQMAILTGNGSGTAIVADTGGTFSGFLGDVAINDAGIVVFNGYRDTGVVVYTGIYTGPQPGDVVAEHPGAFDDLGDFAINASDTILFVGRRGIAETFEKGFFVENSLVVDVSGSAAFDFYLPALNDAGEVAYRVLLDNLHYGIYRAEPVIPGSTVYDDAVLVAGDSGVFESVGFGVSINESGTIAFTARVAGGPSGIFIGSNPATDTIVDTTGPYGNFAYPVSIDDTGRVTFEAGLDNTRLGIFTGADPVADRVIQTLDPLFGGTVVGLEFSSTGSNAAGDVAFAYALSNGRTGVAIATVPEPSAASESLAAAFLLFAVALRRSAR